MAIAVFGKNQNKGYLTLKDANKSVVNLPITSFLVSLNIDYNIHKTLNGNFAASIYADKPVTIRLIGFVHANSSICLGGAGAPPKGSTLKDLQLFFNTSKGSCALTQNKIGLTVIQIDEKIYNCMLVGLDYSNDPKYPHMISFKLTFLGTFASRIDS